PPADGPRCGIHVRAGTARRWSAKQGFGAKEKMTQYHDTRQKEKQWEDVDQYLIGLFVPDDAVLGETFRTSDAAGLPRIAVSANQGKLLMILAKSCGARNILEIGTLGGYSTI